MGLAHIAATNQADPDFRHAALPKDSSNTSIATGCKISIVPSNATQALFANRPAT